jgi:hypothetical protein
MGKNKLQELFLPYWSTSMETNQLWRGLCFWKLQNYEGAQKRKKNVKIWVE